MSAKLIILALICAVAYAQAGIVSSVYSGTADCTKGAFEPFVTNHTTGVDGCASSSTASQTYYFDATNVYSVSFYGAGCNGTISSVTQIPTGCNTQTFGNFWTTYGSSETLPFGTFPPANFATSSAFYNTSESDAKATGCSAGNGVVEVKSASNGAYCNSRADGTFTTQPSSTSGFCNADGTQSGTVVFSDATCTTPAMGSSMAISACTITSGVAFSSSCGSTPVFPEAVPTQGWFQYTDTECGSANPSTYYVGPTCFDSMTLVCGAVNGTDGYATFTASSPAAGAASGTCAGDVRATQAVLANTCVQFGGASRKYFCTSPDGGSASTASVSIVATLLAAVAAVFAVRSL